MAISIIKWKNLLLSGSLALGLIPFTLLHPQSSSYKPARIDPNTISIEREAFRKHLRENIIKKNLELPLTDSTEEKWKGAYWACELSYFRDTLVIKSLKEALRQYSLRSNEFNRASLEAVYTLYPSGFEKELDELLQTTTIPKHFALGAEYIFRSAPNKEQSKEDLLKLMMKKFPFWQKDPILLMLNQRLNGKETALPPVRDLLNHSYWKGRTVIFSFQRKDRNYEGLTVIMGPDGRFQKDSTGNIFYIHQLARALSNLPGYLTNGNTPAGIYTVIKIDTSDNRFIGSTPFILTALPFEADPGVFFKDTSLVNVPWSKSLYAKLLPESWQDFFPAYQTYYAGMAGRSEIVMHGTTIDPGFYKSYPFYPNTPSLGCITSKEIYSPENGKLILSDQQKLIDSFITSYNKEAFLIVIELDDKQARVDIDEIMPLIYDSEK